MHAAESVATLLGRLDVSAFPLDEQIAVGECQARAIDEWLDLYVARNEGPAAVSDAGAPRAADTLMGIRALPPLT
jgi:hypothetical protein